jgi:hypothetical protein
MDVPLPGVTMVIAVVSIFVTSGNLGIKQPGSPCDFALLTAVFSSSIAMVSDCIAPTLIIIMTSAITTVPV